MSGFFGFDAALPERRNQLNQQQFSGFQPSNTAQTFPLGGAGEEEDLAVYNWGDSANLLDGGDDLNDETFGGNPNIGKDFLD